MATSYKTPGVYIEEIPKFPPSIAAVETAIPAFIGYTQFDKLKGELLTGKAVPIDSIAEYEEIFGTAPRQAVTVELDAFNNFSNAKPTVAFYLYDSLRMFYANGGGKCYIITLGAYPASTTGLTAAPYDAAFIALENEDEPTLIVMPDAVHLGNSLYTVQQNALAQSGKLKDRFVICDLEKALDKAAFATSVKNFRDKIGINNLKYAAAYGPWIQAGLPRFITRRNMPIERSGTPGTDILQSLTSDSDIKNLITTLIGVENSVYGGNGINSIEQVEETLSGGAVGSKKKLTDRLAEVFDAYRTEAAKGAPAKAVLQTALQGIAAFYLAVIKRVRLAETSAPDPATTLFKIKSDLEKFRLNSGLMSGLLLLAGHHKALEANTAGPAIVLFAAVDLTDLASYLGFGTSALMLADASLPDLTANYTTAGLTDINRAEIAFNALTAASAGILEDFRFYARTLSEYELKLNQALLESFGTYKTLAAKAADTLNLMPPSGIMAGIYAAVDRDRGVWKAPANVSLSSVIAPALQVSHEEQESYNVDVNAGKSINIIRFFIGKGTLVWGARTLAGNDNEWRYVSVRRFFNFVEESVKKATEQFVFEPNDANTWVKVQAMIENFLTVLWRQGALQGIKPEHAFYVVVGLGKTMTPLDILEGRMIIEIGMAAVRPAEFIILKFSHKMAES